MPEVRRHHFTPGAGTRRAADLLAEAECTPQWRSSTEDLQAFFWNSTQAYDAVPRSGDDDAPETAAAAMHLRRVHGVELRVGDCQVTTDTGTWHNELIGPILSTGGYDWWVFGWTDSASLRSRLAAESVLGITAQYTGPVTEGGEPIGYPPIHPHHSSLLPCLIGECSRVSATMPPLAFSQSGKGTPVAKMEPVRVALANSNEHPCSSWGYCDDAVPTFSVHVGDRQRAATPAGEETRGDGTDSTSFDYSGGAPDGGYIKLIARPLTSTHISNDVRPAGSPPLKWWFRVALHVESVYGSVQRGNGAARSRRPVSVHVIYGPSTLPLLNSHAFNTNAVPSHTDSFHWATYRLPIRGRMVTSLTYFHIHHTVQEALLFLAAPSQVGLGQAELNLEAACKARLTSTASRLGVQNNTALRHYLLQSLARSRVGEAKWWAISTHAAKAGDLSGISSERGHEWHQDFARDWGAPADAPAPRLLCHAISTQALHPEQTWGPPQLELFDRSSRMRCAQWEFSFGDQLTMVVMHGPSALRRTPTGSGWWRGHSDFWIHYVSDSSSDQDLNRRSAYTFQQLNDAAASAPDAFSELLAMDQPKCVPV